MFVQSVLFTFVTKVYFLMLRVRVTLKLTMFNVHVLQHVQRLMPLTLFYPVNTIRTI